MIITRTRRAAAVAAASALLVLGACTNSGAGGSPQSEAPAETPAASASPALTQVAFGKTHRYPDGVTLTMSKISKRKLGPFPNTEDPEAKEGDEYVAFTLAFDNPSKVRVELTPYVVVRVGPDRREAPRVYEGESREALILEAGDSTEYDVACLIPEADRGTVVLEIIDTPDPSRNIALAGSID
jgi:hypothetical protein